MRFDEPSEARQRLINEIWPSGLPDEAPVIGQRVRTPSQLEAVTAEIELVEVVEVEVFGFESTTYVLHPPRSQERLAIVHGGHQPSDQVQVLGGGLAETVDLFLEEKFIVAVMQMPLFGWNHDHTGAVGADAARIPDSDPNRHDLLFDFLEPRLGSETLRVFLEPVTYILNAYGPAVMVGLSGGGWTTHLSAAIDDRIRLSVPVAGSLPLYARGSDPAEIGDREQTYAPIFGVEDSDGDGIEDTATGVASWLEIYLLSADGGRRQVQVINLYDPCCFGGDAYQSYSDFVSERAPGWSVWVDTTHEQHQISPAAREMISSLLHEG